jgi:TonB family protein
VQPFNQRQGFLVSAIVHLLLLMILVSHPPSRSPSATPEADLSPKKEAVFLPPPAVLRQILPSLRRPPRTAPRLAPRPAPTPAPRPTERLKDRISIGAPTENQAKGPIILRRDQEITAAKGRPDAAPAPAPRPAPALPQQAKDGKGAPDVPGREGLRLPPGLGKELQGGQEGFKGRPGLVGPSLEASVDEVVQRRLEQDAKLGIPTGTSQNVGGLSFDPQGADFTDWINHFKNEVYRNWIVPHPALLGSRGHVDIEFTVERDGSISRLVILKGAGRGLESLDRAAQNALQGSRFLHLPSDYGPPRVTMQVIFFYNEGPQGS